MQIFNPKCSQCGQTISRDARYCPHCGNPTAGGQRKCGVCGTENRSDASFCKGCGRSLSESQAPEMRGNRWTRHEDDFAVRIETEDLKGLLKRGLQIDPGANALMIEQGQVVATVAPGAYTLETIPQHLSNWVREVVGGVAKRITALLVDITPTEFAFHLGGRYTQDEMPVGISIRLQAEVREPGKFLVNMLKSKERLSKEDLRAYLYPEVIQVADRWLRQHTLEQIVDEYSLRQALELDLEEALRTTFGQSGLHFLYTRTVELNLEPYDHLKGVRSKYSLQAAEFKADADGKLGLFDVQSGAQVSEAEARLKARQMLFDVQQKIDFHELAEQTHLVKLEEQKVELYERMRDAVQSDKMNEVRSEADFERFMNEIDIEKLLLEKERQEMQKTWREAAQDHDLARAHLLKKLEIEQQAELSIARIRLKFVDDKEQLENEITLARKTAEFRWEMEARQVDEQFKNDRKRLQIEIERARVQDEIERIKMDREMDEAAKGIELLSKMKEVRRLDEEERLRIQREHELQLEWQRLEMQIKWFETEERGRQSERQYQLQRVEALSKASVETLISLSGAEQGKLLAELKRTEALKGMSEEQILAMAAMESPEVARAFQEKFRAMAEGKSSERERELYEKLLGWNETRLQDMRLEADKRAADIKETSKVGIEQLSATAQAFARGSAGQPVIVVPGSGSSQVMHPTNAVGATDREESKVCPKCGRFVPADAHFCVHCGEKFEGIG